MKDEKSTHNEHNDDNINRAEFLRCMAWAGTGVLWLMSGGTLKSFGMSQLIDKATGTVKSGLTLPKSDFSFVQISDSHIGFSKPANTNVVGTLQAAIGKINGLAEKPSFILHTGDITHLAQPEEFDTAEVLLRELRTDQVFYVPGEHDVTDNGKQYLQRFGKNTKGQGWYSFDKNGVHFVALVNVLSQGDGGLGMLGKEQLEWLAKDLAPLRASTPVVVFAHVPLWAVYPQWGWGTSDSEQALTHLKRFGSVTVLNGHIHQTMLKVEGNITFHSAMSTAFPQPAPGSAPSPGPMKVPAEKLMSVLGLASVQYHAHRHSLAITDSPLEADTKTTINPKEK